MIDNDGLTVTETHGVDRRLPISGLREGAGGQPGDQLPRLEHLLELEMAAVETYRQLLERLDDQPGTAQLRSIQRDHQDAADYLRRHILRSGGLRSGGLRSGGLRSGGLRGGGRPSRVAAVWWSGGDAAESAPDLLADRRTLSRLRLGEERGLEAFRRVLEEDGLSFDCRSYIHGTLLPRQHHHISTLQRWMEVQ